MREIKFRAWSKEEKLMIYFSSHWAIDGEYSNLGFTLEYKEKNFFESYEGAEKEAILMQYTGLKDKNGKEICEGDIVKDEVGNAEVVFGYHITSTDDWGVEHGTIGFAKKWNDGSGYSGLNPDKELEIIGNIYENPELLKEEK